MNIFVAAMSTTNGGQRIKPKTFTELSHALPCFSGSDAPLLKNRKKPSIGDVIGGFIRCPPLAVLAAENIYVCMYI